MERQWGGYTECSVLSREGESEAAGRPWVGLARGEICKMSALIYFHTLSTFFYLIYLLYSIALFYLGGVIKLSSSTLYYKARKGVISLTH